MGFMNATFYGYAKQFIVGNRCFNNVFVELNLKDGVFNLYLPENKVTIVSQQKNLEKLNIQLINIEIITPFLKLTAENITDVFIENMTLLPGWHIGSSFLTNALNLIPAFSKKKTLYGYYKISLIPRKSFLGFVVENLIPEKEKCVQEIVFKNFYLGIEPPVAFSELYQKYGIVLKEANEAGLFSISFTKQVKNLEDYCNAFRLALSYVQGREVDRLLVLDNKNLYVYFENSLGRGLFKLIPTQIIENVNWFQEYLLKFIDYWNSVNNYEKNIFRRIITNLIYSKTKDVEIESKFAHLFTVFEIICNGKIEKNKLRNKMNLPLYDAKFIVSLRNCIFHGYSFEEAIDFAFQESEKEADRENSIFLKLKEIIKSKEILGCLKIYYALIKLLDVYVLNQIGYTGKWYNPLNEFSEEYIKEILLEDEELLKELKNR